MNIIYTILSLAVTGSIMFLILLSLRSVLRKRLPQWAVYLLFVMVVVRLLIPFSPTFSLMQKVYDSGVERNQSYQSNQSVHEAALEENLQQTEDLPSDALATHSNTHEQPFGKAYYVSPVNPQKSESVASPWTAVFFGIWLVGAIICFGRTVIGYAAFRRAITKNCRPAGVPNSSALPVLITNEVDSPMLIGVIKPVILLPEQDLPAWQMQSTLRHETAHYRRGDILVKWAMELCCAVYWFNPLILMLRRELNEACERACDEYVVRNMTETERKTYIRAIVESAAKSKYQGRKTTLATAMTSAASRLKERLEDAMKYKRTSKAGLLVSIVAVAVLAAAGLLLGACAENTAIIDRAEFIDNRFSYNLTGAASFTVNDDKLYASFLNDSDIRVYDHNGVQVDTLNFGDGFHTNLSSYDGKLYAYTHGLNASSITIYNLNTDECTAYTIDPAISVPLAMTVLDGRVYLIYRSDLFDPYQQSVKFSDEDNYVYMGEKAVSLDVATFETEEIGINNVLNLKPYSETEILYYAYDDIGGYYFTVYNTRSKTFSEKTYNNTTSGTFAFDYNKSADSIVFSDFSNRKLVSVSMMEPDTQIDFMHNVVAVSGNDVQFCNGSCYVLDGVSGNVLRTEYDEAVKSNEEIIFRTPEIYSETPYGCGYNINTQMISDDEFALNILAEDSDYDICMMSSKQPFSRNIREQGAFYPLNDVPMVQEYLDACFPYLKEAAFNNGEIWMIPIAVDIPCILYNPENCEKYDIVLDDAATWQYLFDTADRLYGSDELRDKFQLNGYQAEDDIIHRYNSYYAFQGDSISYNTPLFRDTCVMLKSNDMTSESLHTRISPPTFYDNLSDYYGEYLFELTPYCFSMFYEETFSVLRAAPTPSLSDNEPNCAECIYLCVNSNSDNLSSALEYISSYCGYMLMRNDTYMLRDKSIYPYSDTQLAEDLYGIYSDAEIDFTPSEEMFWADYRKYSQGEIDLDTFISEIERKTDMYLYE